MTTYLEIKRRAIACIKRLPARSVSAGTARAYEREFGRMLEEPTLDPLRPGISRDTYLYRRAAMHFMIRRTLVDLCIPYLEAINRNDMPAILFHGKELGWALAKFEPALELEPPLASETSRWDSRSRWHDVADQAPPRGARSKKHVLRELPGDWMAQLWRGVPEDWPYRAVLAVHMLAPVRPAEFVPGARPQGKFSEGVEVLTQDKLIEISYQPVKSHGGKFGTGKTSITIDPRSGGEAAAYLARLCMNAGGRLIVRLQSTNVFRKALGRLGRSALPDVHVTITPYVFRQQFIADLKATVGAGAEVAAAAGHCTDRTQSHYGRVQHGRRRRGIVKVWSVRKPSVGNTARGHALRAERQLAIPGSRKGAPRRRG